MTQNTLAQCRDYWFRVGRQAFADTWLWVKVNWKKAFGVPFVVLFVACLTAWRYFDPKLVQDNLTSLGALLFSPVLLSVPYFLYRILWLPSIMAAEHVVEVESLNGTIAELEDRLTPRLAIFSDKDSADCVKDTVEGGPIGFPSPSDPTTIKRLCRVGISNVSKASITDIRVSCHILRASALGCLGATELAAGPLPLAPDMGFPRTTQFTLNGDESRFVDVVSQRWEEFSKMGGAARRPPHDGLLHFCCLGDNRAYSVGNGPYVVKISVTAFNGVGVEQCFKIDVNDAAGRHQLASLTPV